MKLQSAGHAAPPVEGVGWDEAGGGLHAESVLRH